MKKVVYFTKNVPNRHLNVVQKTLFGAFENADEQAEENAIAKAVATAENALDKSIESGKKAIEIVTDKVVKMAMSALDNTTSIQTEIAAKRALAKAERVRDHIRERLVVAFVQ